MRPKARPAANSEEFRAWKLSPTNVHIEMNAIVSLRNTDPMLSATLENEMIEKSPLTEIIERTNRKAWAKVVAPVDQHAAKKRQTSLFEYFQNVVRRVKSPTQWILNSIEQRYGYTIRSYFQFILWLFYLNVMIFILCFSCIVLPTYIYPENDDFYSYAIDQYNRTNTITMENFCNLQDPRCSALNEPLSSTLNQTNSTCLENPFTASSCCSLLAENYFIDSSENKGGSSFDYFSNFIDGTGRFSLNRLFLGYYRNLSRTNEQKEIFDNYNMGLAVFLGNLAAIILTALAIIRKFGKGMKQSYVQSESFQNNLFQYVFGRWDYRIVRDAARKRNAQRFCIEIENIFLEKESKVSFKFDRVIDKIVFQMKRIGSWMFTILIFAGALTSIYFVNRFSLQERGKKEQNSDLTDVNGWRDLAVEYLPSVTISAINLLSQFVFIYMKDMNLYTKTTSIRHYLIRVILMRLLILFTFVFILILQITCNGNRCGQQSALIDCNDVQGTATFIHCWETLIGQMIYRLIITDTAVLVVVHLIVDPLRLLLIYLVSLRKKVPTETGQDNKKSFFSFLLEPPEFDISNYVLELAYTQTLCWHGLLFSPFFSLIAALKNLLVFFIKLITLIFFRRKSTVELSPARARYIFNAVLLFSFVWALLPLTYFVTSLKPSRGCSPFRVYSDETEYYIYYSLRNIIVRLPSEVLAQFILKLTNAVVIIPTTLVLIMYCCILIIQRNSYRAASQELYKFLHSVQVTHQLGRANAVVTAV